MLPFYFPQRCFIFDLFTNCFSSCVFRGIPLRYGGGSSGKRVFVFSTVNFSIDSGNAEKGPEYFQNLSDESGAFVSGHELLPLLSVMEMVAENSLPVDRRRKVDRIYGCQQGGYERALKTLTIGTKVMA